MINIQAKINEIKKHCDATQAISEFKTASAGADDGATKTPPPGSSGHSVTERRVIAFYDNKLAEGISLFRKEVSTLIDERKLSTQKIDPVQDKTSFNVTKSGLLPKLTAAFTTLRTQISPFAEAAEAESIHFNNFRVQNGLTGKVAREQPSVWKHWRLIIIGFLIEVLLTAYFYAEVSPYGPLGGVFLALSFSGISTLAALAAGDRFPYVNHVNLTKKIGYVSLSLIFFASFILVALIGAHLRMAINNLDLSAQLANDNTLDVIDVMRAATKDAGERVFSSDILNFSGDALSVLLLIGVSVFGFYAMWKSYTKDDEYPKYGATKRELDKKFAAYEASQSRGLSNIRQLYAGARSEIETVLKNAKKNVDAYESSITEHGNFLSELSMFRAYLTKQLNVTLNSYQTTNTYVRGNVPTPAYFGKVIELDTSGIQAIMPVSDNDLELQKTFKQHIAELSQSYQVTIAEINSMEHGAIVRFDQWVHNLENEVSLILDKKMPVPKEV